MDQSTATAAEPFVQGSSVGPYSLIRELGVGGMGTVFLAEDGRLERKVALKFLTSQLAGNEEFRQRFLREAKSAAKLNHTNIVTVYEVGEDADRVYIAMEYVEGRSLRELIDTRALSYDQILEMFTQLCTGLKKAHEAGIVHRDLKPSNVMVTGDKEVKILDFGLAKAMVDGNLTSTGTALGTVNYMSPEQAHGARADQRSDLFSAGILLFELLTGVNPFVRGYMPATIHAIVYEPVGELSGYNAELPPACQTVVDKCVAKKPEDRYQSIDELLADLARLKAGETIAPAAVAQPDAPRSATPTLAVLHLRNLGSEDDEFLTYGITEDLIVDLSRLGSVRVLPMRKVLKYKDSDLDTEELAKKLGATMILDGSLHRSSSSVRISAQLVDVDSDNILWSNRWEESPDKVGRIKSALAEGIGSALKVDSSVVRKADLGKSDTSNPEAYDFYLKGKYALEKRKKRADVDAAREHFKKALELEPTLLAARVGLAEVHIIDLETDEARKLLSPALEEARRRGLRAEEALVQTVLGIAENRGLDLQLSIDMLSRAVEIYRELKDVNGEARAFTELLKPLLNSAQEAEALKLETRLGELAQAGADAAHIAQGLFLMAQAHARMNDPVRSQALHENALQMARANDVNLVAYQVLRLLAGDYADKGGQHLETAMAYIEEARYIAEKLGDRRALFGIEFTTFFMEMGTGAFRQSLDKLVRLLPEAVEMHDTLGQVSLEWGKTVLLYFMGQYEQCIAQAERLRETAKILERKHITAREAEAHLLTALGHFMLGRHSQALELSARARALAEQADDNESLVDCLAFGGEMLYASGDLTQAREFFESALEKAHGSQNAFCIAVSQGSIALMDLQEGNRESAFGTLRKNVDQVAGHFAEVTARRLLGHALLEHGSEDHDRDEGRRTLLQALNLARKHDNVVEITRIQELLERNE
jgi:serine/threonine protein kinase